MMKIEYLLIMMPLFFSCKHHKEDIKLKIEDSVIKEVWKLENSPITAKSTYVMLYFFNNDTVLQVTDIFTMKVLSNTYSEKILYKFDTASLVLGKRTFTIFPLKDSTLIELKDGNQTFTFKKYSIKDVLNDAFLINWKKFISDDKILNLEDDIPLDNK